MQTAPNDPNFYVNDNIWLEHFNDLTSRGKTIVEYVWIGGSGADIRSKARTLHGRVHSPADCPEWNFDGSSTDQAPGNDSEILLRPVAIFDDPFRKGNHKVAICECFHPDGTPARSNNRAQARKVFDQLTHQGTWWGMEQEYSLINCNGRPLGWPNQGNPGPQGPYYCGNGVDKVYGRAVVEAHYKACLYAGVQVSGVNAEVMPSQWEFQVGPVEGIAIGDQVWMARWILHRLGELFRVGVSFEPKLMPGDWNGAGMHTNFSTAKMRASDGYEEIIEAIERLGKKHDHHMRHYGQGNEKRMTGKHETAGMHEFTYGVANRGASVRIPRTTAQQGKGYFEDRRPASNCDPYVVSSLIAETCLLSDDTN